MKSVRRFLYSFLLVVLMGIGVQGSAFAYASTQSWRIGVYPSYVPSGTVYGSAAAAFDGLAWGPKTFCSAGPPHNVYNASVGETCVSTPSYKIFFVSASCSGGDTLSADWYTCAEASGAMANTQADSLNIIWLALGVVVFGLGFIGGQQR